MAEGNEFTVITKQHHHATLQPVKCKGPRHPKRHKISRALNSKADFLNYENVLAVKSGQFSCQIMYLVETCFPPLRVDVGRDKDYRADSGLGWHAMLRIPMSLSCVRPFCVSFS
ncbi:hypothetical protein NPIL_535531 [Nephila pilipes]|uniref:Uncharacterized protein n=1 Tax=Nephila pilipes TaxID=299642 RepID=A0A8X6TH28_NEPPI|nr:hypothetical protein NPIL_535531 [Nephila pilipes]